MKSRLPAFPSKDKICIICEGDEEYDYLNKLKELRVWNEHNRYGSIISKYTTYWIDFDYNEEGYNKLIKYLE